MYINLMDFIMVCHFIVFVLSLELFVLIIIEIFVFKDMC